MATYDPIAQANITGVILNDENLKSKLDKFSVSIISMSIRYYASLCCIAISNYFCNITIVGSERLSMREWRSIIFYISWWREHLIFSFLPGELSIGD